MAQIEHPMVGHLAGKNIDVVPSEPSRSVNVMSPADERAAASALRDSSLTPEAERAVAERMREDPVIRAEDERRRTLDKILFLGRAHTGRIKLGDSVFIIKLIDGLEGDEIYERVIKWESRTKTQRYSLAYAIVSVDGIPFEDFYEGGDKDMNVVTKKYHVITQWPTSIITQLSRAYEQLVEKFDKEYTVDFLDKKDEERTTG